MKSTMQDYSLTIGAIARHGTTVHTRRQVRTRQPDGTMRVATFAQIGQRTAQLANALRAAGTGIDTVVATVRRFDCLVSRPCDTGCMVH